MAAKPKKAAPKKKTARKARKKKNTAGFDIDIHRKGNLTDRQAAWVFWYTSDGNTLFNGAASCRAAGYQGSETQLARMGYENRRKPHIMEAVQKRLTELFGNAGVSVDKVLVDIEHTRQLALKDGNHSAALRASELHGKYLSMWIERVEHVHTLEDVSTEELVALANQLAGNINGLNINVSAANDGSEKRPGSDSQGDRGEDRAEGA